MELPFVYIDPQEKNEDIANIAQVLTQSRRIIVNDAVSEEMKKAVFDIAMECIGDVRKYYQAKEKETYLLMKDAEIDSLLYQVERELAEKERVNNELRASIESKKRNIQLSEMNIKRSRAKTSDLLRQRKELEQEYKKLSSEAEQRNAVWASSLQTACNQRDRLQMLMDQSPRLAKRNSEINAVKELKKKLEELNLEYSRLQEEEQRLKQEIEFQTATPLRAFVVHLAKLALHTVEMQKKIIETKKEFQQLKDEEAEKIKSGAIECDAFEASFISSEFVLKKGPDHSLQTELIKQTAVPKALGAGDEESSNGESLTTSGSSNKSPSIEPPQATKEDLIRARTNAVNVYVTQQSESILRQIEGSNIVEVIQIEDELRSTHGPEKGDGNTDIEVVSNEDEQDAHSVLENDDINATVDESMGVNASQEVEPGDFSDEEMGPEEVDEDGCVAATEDANDADEFVSEECNMSQQSDDSATEEVNGPGNSDFVSAVATSAKESCPSRMSSGSHGTQDQGKGCTSQSSQQSSVGTVSTESYRREIPTNVMNVTAASSSRSSENVLNVATPSPCVEASQESGALFSTLLNRVPSPMQDGMPFNFGSGANIDDFDPTAVLNISSHSNDPAGDFLSLMESKNEKRERDRQSEGSVSGAEFSFSMFGTSADIGASGGADFAFDFGNPSQNGEESDNAFQFNFGESCNDDASNSKDTRFNFFGF